VAFLASFFLALSPGSVATNEENPDDFNVPKVGATDEESSGGPKDKTLRLTIPAMARIEDDTVPDASGGDEEALKSSAAIHLEGTGFPWEEEPNVYLAGHRLGYPNTASFLAFWDLNKLQKGDKIYLTDANGTRYSYEVFKEFVVAPTDLSVTKPVPGKNLVTLQTCTLPDYSRRLVVQAELIDTSRANPNEGEAQ
jgi:sortase A